MSYNHTTQGYQAFDGFLEALEHLGVTFMEMSTGKGNGERDLRMAIFDIHEPVLGSPCKYWTKHMVVEEYLAFQDPDCDGTDLIAIAVYAEGQRPDLESRKQTSDDETQLLQQGYDELAALVQEIAREREQERYDQETDRLTHVLDGLDHLKR